MAVSSAAADPSSDLANLAGGFVHEIKNHLNTLTLNLQLLAEDFDPPQTPRERSALNRVTKLTDECRRVVDLANDFLRYARPAEPVLVPMDLGPLIARMVDFLGPTARAQGVVVHWFPSPDLPAVGLDKELFETVLLNLMLNAEDAMPQGGTLTLQATAVDGWVMLDVIDTGCGMDAALAKRVVQPFVTTKPGGTGLGLATVQKIVIAHGGRLEVQSEPGRGTKFTICLPVV